MSRQSWSGYAPVEATLEMLASALRDVKGRMRQLFAQERTASNAGLFLDGLLSDEPRKTGWMRSEVVGDPGPWRQQELLGRDRWDADALRDVVCEYAVEHLHAMRTKPRKLNAVSSPLRRLLRCCPTFSCDAV